MPMEWIAMRQRRSVVHHDAAEPASLQQEIRGFQNLIELVAAHPQQSIQCQAGRGCGFRIKCIIAVHERAHFAARRCFRKNRNHRGGAAGRKRTENFGDRAARQSSRHRVQRSNSGRNAFNDTSIEVGKWRWNPLTERGFQSGAKDHRLHIVS